MLISIGCEWFQREPRRGRVRTKEVPNPQKAGATEKDVEGKRVDPLPYLEVSGLQLGSRP
jgi:hypothetical protein